MAGIRDIVRRGFVGSIAAIVTRGYGSIQATAPTITTTSLPGAGQNVAYTTTLEATGDVTITWAVTVGALPTGLTLSAAGILSGTPTTVESQTFTVTATNDSGSDTQEYTLAVAAVSSGGGLARSGTAPTGRGLLRLSRG
jgi:uncharacterized repeat protein (TIGR01451 family)